MRTPNLRELSIEQLVERFEAIGLAEEDEVLYGDGGSREFNKLFDKEQAVVDELQRRPGDQRRVLLALYDHESWWVRLSAIKNSLVFAPDEGRKVLQALVGTKKQPYAGEAGMTLRALNKGIFVPE